MDGSDFDTLARALFTSRRSTIKTVVAGALSALFTSRGKEVARAGCKKVGKKCDKNKDCCDGAKCKGDGGKKKGKCRCKSGLEDCDGRCSSVTDDDANCGACGVACATDEFCRDSACQSCVPITPPFEASAGSCSSDRECCDNGTCCTFNDVGGPVSSCFDLLTHTTACGLSCDAAVNCFNTDQICVNGVCVEP